MTLSSLTPWNVSVRAPGDVTTAGSVDVASFWPLPEALGATAEAEFVFPPAVAAGFVPFPWLCGSAGVVSFWPIPEALGDVRPLAAAFSLCSFRFRFIISLGSSSSPKSDRCGFVW